MATEEYGDRIKYTKANSIIAYERLKEEKSIQRQKKIDIGERQIWEYEKFLKLNLKELQMIIPNLDVYEKALLCSIIPYVGYEDCCIKSINGIELDIDKMIEISGISKRKLQDVIKSLVNKHILYKKKNGKKCKYFVNPWLVCKGNTINGNLKAMFKDYEIQILDGIRWKELR